MSVDEVELKLEFETAPFLHSLFANDAQELHYLEQRLEVRTVTRDGWVLIVGPEDGVNAAERVFADLEQAKRNGAEITPRDFRMAVDVAT